MSSAGHILAMISSLKNNRSKKHRGKPFEREKKFLKHPHIETHDSVHMNDKEFKRFRMKLMQEKMKDQNKELLVFITVVVIGVFFIIWFLW